MIGDLYGFAVIAATLATLIVGVTPDYRNHSGDIEELLAWLLYVFIAPLIAGIAAMVAGDVTMVTACFLVGLSFSCVWLMAALSYFVLCA